MNKKKAIKKIGIFTSGGDCSGLNAVLNAVVRRAYEQNIEVYGIFNGASGLVYPNLNYTRLTIKDFQNHSSCLRSAGTILGSIGRSTKDPMENKDGFIKGVKELGLDSLIVVGGDGTASIISDYIKDTDINIICVPKTIDNDTPVTDYSVGFDTARNVCMECLDKLQTTAFSHQRVMIMEVMGREAGHLALHSAIAGGANICLIPEIDYKFENILKKLREIKKCDIAYSLIVVAEGCKTESGEKIMTKKNGVMNYNGFSNYLTQKLEEEKDNFVVRQTILGHIQRGGTPTAFDRIIATQFGVYAVDLLIKNKSNRMIVVKKGNITDVDLFEAVNEGPRFVTKDNPLLKTAKSLGIYIGEI